MSPRKAIEPSFEEALARLEQIVTRIEDEELGLDEALALFEEGIRLLRSAEQKLSIVEARVRQLIELGEELRLEEFTGER
jgi:exodeoxyribonuclease VII small subunit